MKTPLIIISGLLLVLVLGLIMPKRLEQQAIAKPSKLEQPNPITPYDSVHLEELTWMEVRDAIAAGKTRVIIPTGGIEQSGPYLPLGKHNYIIKELTDRIARALKDTLVAPVIPFVYEGQIDNPSGHMLFPGTISIRDATFSQLVRDIVSSLSKHGFREFVLLGDSGDNQRQLAEIASSLNKELKQLKTVYIPEYYNYKELEQILSDRGYKQTPEGIHDDLSFTSHLAAIDPNLVRWKERLAAKLLSINGISLEPLADTQQLGRELMQLRIEKTVQAIKRALAR